MQTRCPVLLNDDQGFSLVEILVAISFSAIVSLGLLKAMLLSQGLGNKTVHESLAMQLALEQMETFASVDPSTFSDSMDDEEDAVLRSGYSFRRVTDITVNSDRSRSVNVVVASNYPGAEVEVTVENTFALWGER